MFNPNLPDVLMLIDGRVVRVFFLAKISKPMTLSIPPALDWLEGNTKRPAGSTKIVQQDKLMFLL